MQAFFVITGYCSNFYKSFHKHIWDDFRTLILPAIIFAIVIKGFDGELNWKSALDSIILLGGAWFVIALFFCKAINWVLFRFEKTSFRLLFSSILSFVGLCIGIQWYYYDTTLYYIQQALAMILFIQMGFLLRTHNLHKNKICTCSCALLFFCITGYSIITHNYLPWFGFVFDMSLSQIPFVLLLSTTGTLALFQ